MLKILITYWVDICEEKGGCILYSTYIKSINRKMENIWMSDIDFTLY